MNGRYCVKMPYLRHNPLKNYNGDACCLHFWPGLPYSDVVDFKLKYWLSPILPLEEKHALSLLRSMRSLDAEEISRLLHVEHASQIYDEIKLRAEMSDLDRFAGKSSTLRPQVFSAEHAQKILLWRWLEESLWEELTDISSLCDGKAAALASVFGESPSIWRLTHDAIRGSSWRTVVVNALFFLPADMPILCEGQMAEDLSEILDFSENADLAAAMGLAAENRSLALASATGVQALGLHGSEFPDFLTIRRSWLIWSEKP